jgi:hypothetical protein
MDTLLRVPPLMLRLNVAIVQEMSLETEREVLGVNVALQVALSETVGDSEMLSEPVSLNESVGERELLSVGLGLEDSVLLYVAVREILTESVNEGDTEELMSDEGLIEPDSDTLPLKVNGSRNERHRLNESLSETEKLSDFEVEGDASGVGESVTVSDGVSETLAGLCGVCDAATSPTDTVALVADWDTDGEIVGSTLPERLHDGVADSETLHEMLREASSETLPLADGDRVRESLRDDVPLGPDIDSDKECVVDRLDVYDAL